MAFLVNCMWAAQYPAYKVAAASMGPATLNFWTFVIATLVLLPFLLIERHRRVTRSSWAAEFSRFFLLAGAGLIPPSVILSWGIDHSTASNGSILALTIPVFMVVIAFLLLRERPQKHFLISLALALLGTALMSWSDIAAGSLTGNLLVGNLAILFASAGAAFYNAYGKRLLESHSGVQILIFGYVVAIVLCAIISVLFESEAFYHVTKWPLRAWIGVAVLGTLSWGVAMAIWFWLLNQLQLTQISVSVYMLPVLGVALSALTLRESLSLIQLLGGVLALGSAYLCAGRADPNNRV